VHSRALELVKQAKTKKKSKRRKKENLTDTFFPAIFLLTDLNPGYNKNNNGQ